MHPTRPLVLLSFLAVAPLLSCDFRDSDPKGILDPTTLVEDLGGPIPGLLSESAPEAGPATGGPEPNLPGPGPSSDLMVPGPVAPSPSLRGPQAQGPAPSPGGGGGGGSDLLWRHRTQGQNALWEMDGLSYVDLYWLRGVSDTNWKVGGVADFTGDGKADILWRSTATRQNAVWEMDGVEYVGLHWVRSVSDGTWEVKGVGDFTGDGKADILWRRSTTGELALWEMNGLAYVGVQFLRRVSDLNWDVKGVGDLTGDGKVDIVWRNTATGQNAVWEMDGVAYVGMQWLPAVSDLNWALVGVGDMTGDGKTDIVWRNTATGQNAVWAMDATTRTAVHWLRSVADTNWEMVGVGAFTPKGPDGDPFVTTWNTSLAAGTTVTLALAGEVNATIHWGDGAVTTVTTPGPHVHDYGTNGVYTVSVTGSVTAYNSFDHGGVVPERHKLVSVDSWGQVGFTSLSFAFHGAVNLVSVPEDTEGIGTVTDMGGMFFGATLFNGDLGGWDVSNVDRMQSMFWGATSFNQDLGGWNVSNVTNMYGMFRDAESFNGDIMSWDVSNVTAMSYMFFGATSFNRDLSVWCVSLITTAPDGFDAGATSWVLPRPMWGTCPAGLGMGFGPEQFALIPAGTFQMGDLVGNGWEDELPVHTVTITTDFYMQKTAVTQGQWTAVMGENPSDFSGCGDLCPVETVSWEDIQTFLAALNAMDPGKDYRLPTEAEWEFAARAGSTGDYGGTGVLDQMGWYAGNSDGQPHPVALKQGNHWGLYDMHGNVWEWVQDWYSATYYSESPEEDPQGPATGAYRVIRGGSWLSFASLARLSSRNVSIPGARNYTVGFRLVRSH